MTRRGVAMILVLAACVVILTASAVVAQARANAALGAGTTDGLAMALELAEASEDATIAWLRHASREVVLEPSPEIIGVPIMNDRLEIGRREITVRVTAWDQCAMLPNTDLSDLPAMARLAGDQRPAWAGDRFPGADHTKTIPSARHDAASVRFATHNPEPNGQRQRGGASAAVNINTAPEPLLRAACADLGVASADSILVARRSGERATITTAGRADPSGLRLVAASTVWSVRTDIGVSGPGGASVAVWTVYTLVGGTWSRVQRFVIVD